MKISTYTLKAIVRAFNAASEDVTRIHINAVRMQVSKGGQVTLAATDGCILHESSFVDAYFRDDKAPECVVMIEREYLTTLKAFIKPLKNIDSVECELKEKCLMISALGNQLTLKSDLKFPDYKKIIPSGEGYKVICFNADLLMQLVDSYRDKSRRGKRIVTLELAKVNSPNSPVKVHIQGEDGEAQIGILMPMRADNLVRLDSMVTENDKGKE